MSEKKILSDEVLSKVLDSLKTKVSEFNFNNWFLTSQWSFEGERRLVVTVPNRFVRDWITDNYLEVIKFELFKVTGAEHEIQFIVPSHEVPTPLSSTSTPSVSAQVKTVEKVARPPSGLNPRYTFGNFVVGSSNQFVNAACRAVAANPAKNYNPLFIYGGVGLGKTHLLNSMGIEIISKHPHQRVVFVTGEQFTNEVINSIRYDKTYDLRKKYRVNCDLLFIDDVQFIAGKERTMEEFFHTFNTLYEGRKQIVMTSDTLPKDIPNLEERLRSRFGWGLLADIQAPDFETRSAILRKKAEDDHIKLPNEVCELLASRIKSNVRDLEGCLIRVSAFAALASVPITESLANEVLRNISKGFSPCLSIESVQQSVAEHFNLKVSDLKSPRRHKNLAVPRQIAMYLCKKHVKASFPEIGNKFGGKDHTTVIHAVRRVNEYISNDQSFKDRIDELEKLIAQ